MVPGIDGLVGAFDIPDITAKVFFDFIHAGLNIEPGPLQEGLDRTIRQIANKASQIITVCGTVCCIPETDSLHPALENNMFGNLIHGPILEPLGFRRNKKGETAWTASPDRNRFFRCV